MAVDNLPPTMRSLFQPDPQSTKLILATVPLPVPKPGSDEHLIRVHTAAITNGELVWLKNFPAAFPPGRELTPLFDMAGTVVTCPPGSPFKPGDEVFARTAATRTGSGREYIVAPTVELALRPKSISWAETATAGMSVETAWQALFVQAGWKAQKGAQKGKKVYVTAASGSVGTWIVQLARWAGAEVIASSGADSIERVKLLGASEVLDYRAVNIKEWALSDPSHNVDLVIDCIGRNSLADAWWVVKSGGTLISIFEPPEQQRPKEIDAEKERIKNFFFIQEALGEHLKKVVEIWEEEGFKTALDSVYPLEKFEEAVARLESGKARGKVVLDMGVAK